MNYVANTPQDQAAMLNDIGAPSIEALFSDVPEKLRVKGLKNIPEPASEMEVLSKIRSLAGRNSSFSAYKNFMGAGSYEHFIPSVVSAVTGRSDFYTAYTPYQPEVSQGTLMSIFEYQTMICNLTGMEVSNASHYDGATALAEAMIMSYNVNGRREFLVAESVNPRYMKVLKTYAAAADFRLKTIPVDRRTGKLDAEFANSAMSDSVSAVLVQNPSYLGVVENFSALSGSAHKNGSVFVVSANPISLGLLAPPSSYGADIVCGEGQPLGIPPSFGGPNLGFMATSQKLMRRMPGRIVGETVDKNGRRAYVLTLQAREQHIRREKASSNICSNEALCALAATVYLSYVGPHGLRKVAARCSDLAHYMAREISKVKGFEVAFEGTPFFHEFVVKFPASLTFDRLFDHFHASGILPGVSLSDLYPGEPNQMLVCATEVRTKQEIDSYVKRLGELKW